jgi:neutral ceramidase
VKLRHSLFACLLLVSIGCGDDGGTGGDPDAGTGEVTTEHCDYTAVAPTAGAGGTVSAGALEAGAAEAVLDMPVGTALGSYTARAGFLGMAAKVDLRTIPMSGSFNPSIGIETRPKVKALALTAGGETVVIVKVDIGFSYEELTFELENRLGPAYAGKVLIATSHSHSAWGQYSGHSGLMAGCGVRRNLVTERFLDILEQTSRDALDARRPARLGVFVDSDFDPTNQITRDRRGDNDDLMGGPRKDDMFFLIRVDGTDGAPIAAVPVYGIHGTLNGESNSLASTDAPGGMERLLEEQFDEAVVVMHLQGAGADVSPVGHGGLDCGRAPGDDPDEPCFQWLKAEGNGRAALPLMVAAWEAAGADMQTDLALEMVTRSVKLGPDPATFTVRDGALEYAPFERDREPDGVIFDGQGNIVSPIDEFNAPVGAALCGDEYAIFPAGEMPGVSGEPPYGSCVRIDTAAEILVEGLLKIDHEVDPTRPVCASTRTTLSALRLGEFVLGTVPGEPAVMLADAIRERSPVARDRTIVVGYAQGHMGYALTVEDWLLGGYEPSINFWGPLEGEYLLERLTELFPLVMTDAREDAAADGADRFVAPPVTDELPIDDPAPMAGTIPASVPDEVWVRSGTPDSAQPNATVPRVSGIARFVWIGDDPQVATPVVTLEREVSPGTFEPVRRRSGRTVQDGAVLLMYTPQPLRRIEGEPQTHYWAAELQAVPWLGAVDDADQSLDGLDARAGLPPGSYRFHVAGGNWTVTSDPFEITPTSLQVGASRSGDQIAATVRIEAPKGFRLLDMQLPSNQPVPVRGGTFTVELTLSAGDPIVETGVAIDASGTLTVDAGADAANVTGVTVTDRFGNSGSSTL